MDIQFDVRGRSLALNTRSAISLAIEMDFAGPQPNHFGAAKADAEVLKLGGFVGDTRNGGSCNVDTLTLVPHCNGTHTETISHIVNQDIWIGHVAKDLVMLALLVTVRPESAKTTDESYRPTLEPTDIVITRAMLTSAVQDSIAAVNQRLGETQDSAATELTGSDFQALIIRTLPNSIDKQSQAYSKQNEPPFFTTEAMKFINSLGVRHLLVDIPSLDRMYDDGMLTNHHIFWNVPELTHQLTGESWQDKTITEMVFIGDDVADGAFGLNIQVPAFRSDAAPSRPIIFPIKPTR